MPRYHHVRVPHPAAGRIHKLAKVVNKVKMPAKIAVLLIERRHLLGLRCFLLVEQFPPVPE